MRPQIAQFLLSSDVPDHKLDSFESEFLNIEADGGDGVDDVSKFEWVEDGSLAGSIQTQHHYFALLFGYLLAEDRFEDIAHSNIITWAFDNTIKLTRENYVLPYFCIAQTQVIHKF